MEKHILMSTDGTRLTLPVTPGAYQLRFGMTKKIVTLYGSGEYVLPGRRMAPSVTLNVLFPAQRYHFCTDEWRTPADILVWLQRQVEERHKLLYVITEADFSDYYYLQEVRYGEQDGTGDIYARLTLQQAPEVDIALTSVLENFTPPVTHETTTTGDMDPPELTNPDEDPDEDPPKLELSGTSNYKTYTTKPYDNLWAICWTVYGRDDVIFALMAENGITDPAEEMYGGRTILLPPVDVLLKNGF